MSKKNQPKYPVICNGCKQRRNTVTPGLTYFLCKKCKLLREADEIEKMVAEQLPTMKGSPQIEPRIKTIQVIGNGKLWNGKRI